MNRITDYAELESRIVSWIREYADNNSINALVVGVSGGIDSAVVSTLCARTGIPTFILTMPLASKMDNTILSTSHATYLRETYSNVVMQNVELSSTYEQLMKVIDWWTDMHGGEKGTYTSNQLANANTKSRLRMVTLYQVAGSVGGIVVGTGNKVEDYGIGFYTKYGDGGVDIAPIADLYKTEVWELGRHLGVDQRIIDAAPTDGLCEDSRTDETQVGASYEDLEEAMEYKKGIALNILEEYNKKNKHKMEPIPTFKL